MDKPIDLTNAKARRAAEQATAEKVAAEIAPLFHDADRKAWAHLAIDGHWETFALDSDEMNIISSGLLRTEQSRDWCRSILIKKSLGGNDRRVGGASLV